MKVKVSRIRHPLACFQGEINVEGEKTAIAEEIKLAFDYFSVIDGQNSIVSEKSSVSNGNGSRGIVSAKDSESSEDARFSTQFVKYDSSN